MKKLLLSAYILLIVILFAACRSEKKTVELGTRQLSDAELLRLLDNLKQMPAPGRNDKFVRLSPDGKSIFIHYEKGEDTSFTLTAKQQQRIYELNRNMLPIAKVDDNVLKPFIDSLFSGDSLLKYFGPGLHTFYLEVHVQDWRFITGGFNEYFGSNSLNGSNPYDFFVQGDMIRPGMDFDRSFWRIKSLPFRAGGFILRDKSSFGDQTFEIRKGVDENGRVTHPTEITVADIEKYRVHTEEQFKIGYKESFDFHGEITGIIGGWEVLNEKVVYPEEAKKNGIKGTVAVMALIDEQGNVSGTQLLKSLGFGCDEALINAVKQVRFYRHPNGLKNYWLVTYRFEPVTEYNNCDLECADILVNSDMRRNDIYINVKNNGAEPVPDKRFNIILYIDSSRVFATSERGGLKPGHSTKYYIKWQASPGDHKFTLYIDPENVLHERNRSNNVITEAGIKQDESRKNGLNADTGARRK